MITIFKVDPGIPADSFDIAVKGEQGHFMRMELRAFGKSHAEFIEPCFPGASFLPPGYSIDLSVFIQRISRRFQIGQVTIQQDHFFGAQIGSPFRRIFLRLRFCSSNHKIFINPFFLQHFVYKLS